MLTSYAYDKLTAALRMFALSKGAFQHRAFRMRTDLNSLVGQLSTDDAARLQKHLDRFPAEPKSPAFDPTDRRWKSFTKGNITLLIDELFRLLDADFLETSSLRTRAAAARWAKAEESADSKPAVKKAAAKKARKAVPHESA